MSLLVDETAGDLPVRDVGLMRGGLMPAVPGLCEHPHTCVISWSHSAHTAKSLEIDCLREKV